MFLSLLLATATTIAQPLTIEQIADMPQISSPEISPDGRRIVYVVTTADVPKNVYHSNLWLAGADGSNDIRLTSAAAHDEDPHWSPDGSKIAFLSDRDGGHNAIWIFDARGGEPVKLTDEKAAISEFQWSPDGKSIAFIMGEPSGEKALWHVVDRDVPHTQLYVIDVATREVTRLTHGDSSVGAPSWSPDGSSIAVQLEPAGLSDFQRNDIAVVSRTGELRMLVQRPGADLRPQFSPDGKWIAFTSTGGASDWLREEQIWVVPAAGGTPRLISGDYDRTPERFLWSADSRTIWFDGPWNTTSEIFRVNDDGSGFRDVSNIQGVIGALDVRGGEAAFVMQSLSEPPELYVTSLDAFAPRQISHHNDAYRDRQLGETRVIHWKNPKDGTPIEGLLTLPVGYRPGTRVPLLTFVHGGPASHFDQGFVGYLGTLYPVQVFAAHGFAILRPNPRGTGGSGEKFREANRSDWGGMDWMDINAGIDKLIADGIADPSRLGMMGWSYGGFMTAWAAGHSDRLEAISIGAPVVDLLSFHGTTDIRAFIPSYFPGMPLDQLRTHSPLWTLKRSKARILIEQDDGDIRVPLSQGTMLYRLLQELGDDVTMVVYHSGGHIPQGPAQRIDVMRRNVELFDSALPPRTTGGPGDDGASLTTGATAHLRLH